MVEHRTVDAVVVGSRPIWHPFLVVWLGFVVEFGFAGHVVGPPANQPARIERAGFF